MSIAIDIDQVSDVLLADGWHHVEFAKGKSTFVIDAYEFLEHREKGRDPLVHVGGGLVAGVTSTGRLRGSWWTNAWLRDRIEWPSTSNAPVPSVTAIWESWSPNGRSTPGAGDQWPVPEMWISPCVGCGSRETSAELSARRFNAR